MFIEKPMNSITGAPAERHVSGDGPLRLTSVSLRWSEKESFGGRAFYKHLTPNGANATMFCCTSNLKLTDDK
jgi:hypothetical protein